MPFGRREALRNAAASSPARWNGYAPRRAPSGPCARPQNTESNLQKPPRGAPAQAAGRALTATASCSEIMVHAHDCGAFAVFRARWCHPARRAGAFPRTCASRERMPPPMTSFSAFWAPRGSAKRCGKLPRETEKATPRSGRRQARARGPKTPRRYFKRRPAEPQRKQRVEPSPPLLRAGQRWPPLTIAEFLPFFARAGAIPRAALRHFQGKALRESACRPRGPPLGPFERSEALRSAAASFPTRRKRLRPETGVVRPARAAPKPRASY